MVTIGFELSETAIIREIVGTGDMMKLRHGTGIPCGRAPIPSRINVIWRVRAGFASSGSEMARLVFLESYHETLNDDIVWIAETTKSLSLTRDILMMEKQELTIDNVKAEEWMTSQIVAFSCSAYGEEN